MRLATALVFAAACASNVRGLPAESSQSAGAAALAERTSHRLEGLLAEAAKAPKSEEARKAGDYYASLMDEQAIEQKGLTPLQPQLERIARIKDKQELAKALGETLRADVDALNARNLHTENLFGLWVAQDLDDPKTSAGFLLQGGLGMPDRDGYLDDAARSADLREQYKAYIATVMRLSGAGEPDAKAARIFNLEKRIAEAHATRAESEDAFKGNNHWKRFDFISNAPGLDWETFFAGAGLDGQLGLVVWQEDATIAVSALIGEVPLETWKDYLVFHAVSHVAELLPRAFVEARFAFYGKALAGTPKLPERWRRAVSATSDALGDAVGKLYVERYFPPEEKARAEEMVRNLTSASGKRIDSLTWMSPATKRKAKAKLAALKVGVGYPDKWRDASGLEITRGDALGNAQRASLFEYKRNLAKLGKPVDRGEWVTSAQATFAVNLPAMNALNLPAAMLQPPVFDSARATALDYGAAGAIVDRELGRGFDSQGALFDADGLLHNWWIQEDFANFQAAERPSPGR
jgi:putative endopeptidase